MATKIYRNRMLYLGVFFIFLGFYAGILAFANANVLFLSRYFTIPIRILILVCLAFVYYRSGVRIRDKTSLALFGIFASLYIFRIISDSIFLNIYYIGTNEHLFYFFAFSALPFLLINNSYLTEKDYNISVNALILSAFLFSALASFFFIGFVGTVGRLNAASTQGEAVISPLILSYCSTLAIGFSLSHLLENKIKLSKVLMLLIVMGFSIIPFFLGASRGSLFALFLPFIMVFLAKGDVKSNIRITIVLIVVLVLVVLLSDELGSKLVDRLTSVSEDIDTQSTSAIRLEMWKQSLSQFADNPIIGDSFVLKNFNNYPHNILLEALQTTGLLGFIPFVILIGRGISKCFAIFRRAPQYSWIGIIFLQAFFQSLFSGGIHSSAWFWFGLGLVLQFDFRQVKVNIKPKTLNTAK